MRKLFTILFHPFFILCKNIFVLVETTTNPEVIDDIIKVLPLSKISDDRKNSYFKNSTTRIDQSTTLTPAAVVSRNRQYKTSMLCAIEYCSRQGIALRFHRQDGPLFDEASNNRENVNGTHRENSIIKYKSLSSVHKYLLGCF